MALDITRSSTVAFPADHEGESLTLSLDQFRALADEHKKWPGHATARITREGEHGDFVFRFVWNDRVMTPDEAEDAR